MKSITIKQMVKDLDFLELITDEHTLDNEVSVTEISRPGIQLTGYNDNFATKRIQLFGTQEYNYLRNTDNRGRKLRNFLQPEIPLIVFARNLQPTDEFIAIANELDIPICITKQATSKAFTLLYSYLEYQLAPETQVHGVLLSVFGVGVLIKGASGSGKSEVALELINRGHILVADDAVVIKKTDDSTLIGSAPELLKNRLEIRGIGIVDVQKLYGVTKVVPSKKIELVAEIKPLTGKEDRIGNRLEFESILGVELPKVEIPINAGRSLSNLVEVAVANYELRVEHDYDSADAFVNDLNNILTRGKK